MVRKEKPECTEAEGRGRTGNRDEGGNANQRKYKLELTLVALKR